MTPVTEPFWAQYALWVVEETERDAICSRTGSRLRRNVLRNCGTSGSLGGRSQEPMPEAPSEGLRRRTALDAPAFLAHPLPPGP